MGERGGVNNLNTGEGRAGRRASLISRIMGITRGIEVEDVDADLTGS